MKFRDLGLLELDGRIFSVAEYAGKGMVNDGEAVRHDA